MQFCLTSKKCIHFLRVFVVLGKTELIVYFFIFGKRINYILYAFHYNFFYCLIIIQMRFLRQITY